MNVNNFMLAIILAVGLVIAIFLGIYLPTNSSGSFAAFVKIVGIICVVLALTNPRLGLSIIIVQGGYFDLLKRLAVYFGSASFSIVLEILVIPMLTLAACAIGAVIRSFMQKGHLEKREVLFFLASAIIGTIFFLNQLGRVGFARGAQNTYGIVGFMLLVPLFLIVVKDQNDLLKMLRFMFWVWLPVAIYGLRQALFGFTDFEWYYAKTGFTITAGEVFTTTVRPFSTLASVTAMSVMGGCTFFGYWHVINFRHRRLLYLLVTLVFFAAMMATMLRSAIVIFPVTILAYHAFRTPLRTFALYAVLILSFLFLIVFSGKILNNLDRINELMPKGGPRIGRMFTLGTYSDRLLGFKHFTDPSRWTLFGIDSKEVRNARRHDRYGSDYYNHDGLSSILIGYGAVGLFAVFGGSAFLLFVLHRKIFGIAREASDRERTARLGLAYGIPFLVMNLASGTILHVTPVNIFFWSLIGGTVFSLISATDYSRAQRRVVLDSDVGERLAEEPRMAPAHLRFGNR